MEWTEDAITRLRGLWEEGHSTAEIGRRLGVSKNAVVGKAHRLSLSARPSPIRRDGVERPLRPPAPRRVIGPTLPPLAGAALPRPTEPPPAPMPVRPAPAEAKPVRTGLRTLPCCWPIGEPGSPSFRFCDAEALPGKPYCSDHAQLAYVRLRDRREDAA